MSLRDDILEAQKHAMKEKDHMRTQTLRMLLSAIKNEEIEKHAELTDEEVQKVVARQVKQIEDAKKDFAAGGRDDLVSDADAELTIYKAYLPAQLSDDELGHIVQTVVTSLGEVTAKDMGRVMGAVMKEVQGKADGNRVKAAVQMILNA